MEIRRSGPPRQEAAPHTDTAQSNNPDLAVDLKLVGGINADLWAMLYNNTFRLASKCDICGRWLTSGRSKKAGRGPRCSAKAAEAVGDDV